MICKEIEHAIFMSLNLSEVIYILTTYEPLYHDMYLILCVFARSKVSILPTFMSDETKPFVFHHFLSSFRCSCPYRWGLRVYWNVGLQVWSWVRWRRRFSPEKLWTLSFSIFQLFSSSMLAFETLAEGWRREGTSRDDPPRSWLCDPKTPTVVKIFATLSVTSVKKKFIKKFISLQRLECDVPHWLRRTNHTL